MNKWETLDIIQVAETKISAGTDLLKHLYTFAEVKAIMKKTQEVCMDEFGIVHGKDAERFLKNTGLDKTFTKPKPDVRS